MDALFPLKMGAGVLFSDGSIEVTWQYKGLEYGCTLDAVSQVIYRHKWKYNKTNTL